MGKTQLVLELLMQTASPPSLPATDKMCVSSTRSYSHNSTKQSDKSVETVSLPFSSLLPLAVFVLTAKWSQGNYSKQNRRPISASRLINAINDGPGVLAPAGSGSATLGMTALVAAMGFVSALLL